MDLCSIKTVRQVMAVFGQSFRKEFGQNFLTDRSVVEEIADACFPTPDCTVLEIGPGIGTLTRELCARYRRVVALEIDNGLIPILQYTLSDCPNVTVLREDVLRADLAAILSGAFREGPVVVCANLPYYITSPILMKLLECGLPFDAVTVMVQSEVADRICARPGAKDYGAITAVIAYYGSAERLFTVPADRFVPAPKVNSAVLRIRLYAPAERPCHPNSEEKLFQVVKAAFGQRRKTLVNALSTGFPDLPKDRIAAAVTAVAGDPAVRGERLSISQFSDLSDLL